MTEKQRLFALEYLKDLNGSRAYKAIFKNAKKDETARVNASRLLDKQEIKDFIQEQLKKMEDESVADVKEIMKYLTSVMRGSTKASVLAMCGEGYQEVIKKAPDEKERLKAAELLGRRYGLWGTNSQGIDSNSKDNDKVVIINDLPK